MDLSGLSASVFLDEQGRFCKDEELLFTVRLFFNGGDSPTSTDLTVVQFRALTALERETITNTGSGAGLIDTEHKSNA